MHSGSVYGSGSGKKLLIRIHNTAIKTSFPPKKIIMIIPLQLIRVVGNFGFYVHHLGGIGLFLQLVEKL
jgi:hypothetical protein